MRLDDLDELNELHETLEAISYQIYRLESDLELHVEVTFPETLSGDSAGLNHVFSKERAPLVQKAVNEAVMLNLRKEKADIESRIRAFGVEVE